MDNVVVDWFGPDFGQLEPLLQDLHRTGGVLTGQVELDFGGGLGGLIGRRLARKLGLPASAGSHNFKVDIRHKDGALHWARQFDSLPDMVSVFTPHGHYPDGYWIESTGNLTLHLGVRITDGGWHWVQRKLIFRGITLPLRLFPATKAYKCINNGKYEFSVSFSLPVVGQLLRYCGHLDPEVPGDNAPAGGAL